MHRLAIITIKTTYVLFNQSISLLFYVVGKSGLFLIKENKTKKKVFFERERDRRGDRIKKHSRYLLNGTIVFIFFHFIYAISRKGNRIL